MLSMEMSLEADLGVDSIKRVEILSTMREREPGLPEVDASEMAALQTLGQIVEYMGASSPGSSVSADSTESARASLPAGVGRYVLRVVDAPSAGASMPGLMDGPVAVTDDGTGIAQVVVTQLRDLGVDAAVVARASATHRALIVLDGLSAMPTREAATEVNRRVFGLVRDIAPGFAEGGGLLVTVQSTGGDFGLSGTDPVAAWSGGISGLAKTAALEWPLAQVKAVDMERGDRDAQALGEALVAELLSGGAEREVGLMASGRRVTLASRREVAPSGASSVGEDSVIIASGGARGVTAATLVALSRQTRAAFALLGRTPLSDEPACCSGVADDAGLKRALMQDAIARGERPKPAELGRQVRRILANREIRQTMADMEAAGSRVRYVPTDIQDQSAVNTALASVRSDWGPITGIVHGAGVLADKLIAEKTDEQFNRVFDTKVLGLQVLLDVTSDDPLTFIGLFSSVAGRCGNTGQADYAMANEVLNKVANAENARRDGCVVKSMGWGPWEGGMVTPALRAHFEQLGVPLIPLDVGAQMLVDEVSADHGDVELVLGGAPRGEALASAGRPREATLAVRVHASSHPYLTSHQVQGVVVVPVVFAMEWFAQVASACRPDLHFSQLRDIKVLRGIRVEDFTGKGSWFTLFARQLENGFGATLALELKGADGVVHYRAQAMMTKNPIERRKGSPPSLALQAWGGTIYGDVLFHGPDFQVISSMEGVSEHGIAASLESVETMGWPGGAWRTDPALMDGGLQLALLWTQHRLGGPSLPTAVGEFHYFGAAPPTGTVHAALKGRVVSRDKVVSDVVFTGADGELLAELRGVETHRLT
jgi:hypothetical protein